MLSATTRRRSRPIASPVFGFTSKRGKFELEISRRIRWLIPNRLLVGYSVMVKRTGSPGVTSSPRSRPFRYRSRAMLSVRLSAYPSGYHGLDG